LGTREFGSNNNRFAAFSSLSEEQSFSQNPKTTSNLPQTEEQLKATILQDLSNNSLWPLSCYGLAKQKEHVITGDISQEELRFEAYNHQTRGTLQQYNGTVSTLLEGMRQKNKP